MMTRSTLRAERSHQMRHQIMGQRPLFRDIAHEHGDRAADRLIDIDNEDLVVVPEENGAPPARRQNRAHLHLDDRLVHPGNVIRRRRKTSEPRLVHQPARRFLRSTACMFRALIDYALCGSRR